MNYDINAYRDYFVSAGYCLDVIIQSVPDGAILGTTTKADDNSKRT